MVRSNNGARGTRCTCGFTADENAVKKRIPDGAWKLRQEKRMIVKTEKIFNKQLKWILRESKNLSFLQENTVADEIIRMLDEIPGRKEMATMIVSFARASIKRGGKQTAKELNKVAGVDVAFDVKSPASQQYLDEREALELSNASGNITATTQEGLKNVLSQAHAEGWSYQKTAKKIQEQAAAGVFSRARAQLIATREIGVAYETGGDIMIKDFQTEFPDRQVWKYWQTVNDDRVTPTHRTNQGDGWIVYAQTFSGTGDAHAPGSDNPRCRCFTKRQVAAPDGSIRR